MLFEKQQYQEDCVANIIAILENSDELEDFSSLENSLRHLQKDQSIPVTDLSPEPRLDIMMETGTGKTFAYLKTIFEINKRFGENKFIIVLPRTAIKLGVIQNIKLTDEYFFNEYGRHLNYIDYPKDGLISIQQNFINAKGLSILIITNSAFNSDINKINKRDAEGLFEYGSIWQGVSEQKPVVFIDEPHLLKGTKTTGYLDKLDSLFIRFGATYPRNESHKLSNVVYALDSISAFNNYLVKRIGVNTVFADSEVSGLTIHNVQSKKSFDALYNINEQLHKTTVKLHDDLGAKTGLDQYRGAGVVKINQDKIFLDNKTIIEANTGNYVLNNEEILQMITRTIILHFEKEQTLFEQGVKALSLFFIASIDDFRGENPRIKTIFECEYKTIHQQFYENTSSQEYKKYLEQDYQDGQLQVHEGYFSGDKGSADKKESDGVNIILNEKEKLLSFATPLRFIFSVWALQEGWDNPNIFTICKLSNTSKDTSRRQQVGRGLRIAVNQAGKRLTYKHCGGKDSAFYNINTLDMVVSGQEQDFIHNIQNEIQTASFSVVGDTITLDILKEKGLDDTEAAVIFTGLLNNNIINATGKIQSPILNFLSNHRADFLLINDDQRYEEIKQIFTDNYQNAVTDKNKPPKIIKVRKKKWKEFKDLWETINKKSKIVYKNIKQDELIDKISQEFNKVKISQVKIKTIKEIYDTQKNRVQAISETTDGNASYFQGQKLNLFITKFAKDENLPLPFAVRLFKKLKLSQFYKDPKKSRDLLKTLVKDIIHRSIIKNVSYQFNQTNIYSNELQDESKNLIAEIKPAYLGKVFSDDDVSPPDQFLYDTVVYDSNIEKDSIVSDPSTIGDKQITVFAKLPKINIPTPYKTYNPDFAYLIEGKNVKQLFLVVETKGYKYERDIPVDEKQKIKYAKVFFQDLQKELPEVDIQYKTRINKQGLSELLEGIK